MSEAAQPNTTPHPDAELIRLCAAFTELDAQSKSLYAADGIEDDREREAAIDPLHAAQTALLRRITAMRAVTLEGVQARAKMHAAWDPELAGDWSGMGWDSQMLLALSRDVAELPSVPTLPSIATLGRLADRFRETAERIDAQPAHPTRDDALAAARDREFATVDLIMTLPAETVADAAVQLFHAAGLLERMGLGDENDLRTLRTLRAILASTARATTRAAGIGPGDGVNLGEMEREWETLHSPA